MTVYFGLSAQHTDRVKIACIGNSITYGAGIENRFQDSYPGILSQWLGAEYDVRNFGLNSRTLLKKGDYPYMYEPAYREVKAFAPDIITIKLGTNDSKPHNWQFGKDFKANLNEMLSDLQSLPSHPRIYLCLPIPAAPHTYGIRDSVIVNCIIPEIRSVARKRNIEVIDLYAAMKPHPDFYTDGVHPSEEGAAVIASSLYRTITGNEPPSYSRQSFPGRKSVWEGYDRYDFIFQGRQAIVVTPRKAAKGNPWIWRPAFFAAFPSVDIALLKEGFHVVYYDLTHLYGSPRSVSLGTEFYNIMCQYYHLSPMVTLEGFSRGGLFAFNWAAVNPDKVACIYVDAPVCNVFSWPKRRSTELWNDLLVEWGITEQEAFNFKGNPIDNLKPIANANIPVIAVCGDSDKVVPYVDNMKIVAERFRNLGGLVEVILKPGCDHHPHSLENPEPVVDFIVRNQPDYQMSQVINRRCSLQNSYLKFEKEHRGCVAFLGGSITEMRGWRNMIKDDLKQRFPDTEFTFIDAGISSTGTTPHAFRLEHDVLEKGIPDLMFVEAAVNDDGNHFDYIAQTRGMEGIIRHARSISPEMDIVMMHFIHDPFIPMLNSGIQPDVIMNHERMANYYSIPSINLAEEVACRMRNGEFDWNYFGGTHPSWNGHKIYAAAINHLFDMEWSGDVAKFMSRKHNLPDTPLDPFCYEKGKFIDISMAKGLKGWRIVNDWTPTINVETRQGFVHVPMLVADKPSASLSLEFEGRAVGIFCVCGPNACVLEYSIDGEPFKTIDTHTEWSDFVHLPWVYMFGTELTPTRHTLRLRVAKGERSDCIIRNFVVNGI